MKVLNNTPKEHTNWKPVKRDVNHYLDLISSLRSNIKFQKELNIQISLTKTKCSLLSLPIIYHYLLIAFAPITAFTLINRRK